MALFRDIDPGGVLGQLYLPQFFGHAGSFFLAQTLLDERCVLLALKQLPQRLKPCEVGEHSVDRCVGVCDVLHLAFVFL